MFDALPSLASSTQPVLRDEIDRYLSSPVEKGVGDAMVWWHDRRTLYP